MSAEFSHSPEGSFDYLISAQAAARILTNKLDPRVELTEAELQPNRLPRTSTVLREYAHKTWLEARQRVDAERANREYTVNSRKKQYQEMNLAERVSVWANDVVSFLSDEIQPNTAATWVEGFRALGLPSQRREGQTVTKILSAVGNFLKTDFYTSYCMISPDQSAEAIAGSMVRYFIDSHPKNERQSQVEQMLQTWETMHPLFKQLCDEKTLHAVDLILQSQIHHALGNIKPQMARQQLHPQEATILLSLHRQVQPRTSEMGDEDKLVPFPVAQPNYQVPDEYGVDENLIPESDDDEDEKIVGGSSTRRVRKVPVVSPPQVKGGDTARQKWRTHGRKLSPPIPTTGASLTIGNTDVSIMPPSPLSDLEERENRQPAQPERSEGAEQFDNAVRAYMQARTIAHVNFAKLIALREQLQQDPSHQLLLSERSHVLRTLIPLLLTPEEVSHRQAVDTGIDLLTFMPSLKLFAYLRERLIPSNPHVFETESMFKKLPQKLAEYTGVEINLENSALNAATLMTFMDALQAKGHMPMRETAAQQLVPYTQAELALEASLLTQAPRGELAFYIADIFGIDPLHI